MAPCHRSTRPTGPQPDTESTHLVTTNRYSRQDRVWLTNPFQPHRRLKPSERDKKKNYIVKKWSCCIYFDWVFFHLSTPEIYNYLNAVVVYLRKWVFKFPILLQPRQIGAGAWSTRGSACYEQTPQPLRVARRHHHSYVQSPSRGRECSAVRGEVMSRWCVAGSASRLRFL